MNSTTNKYHCKLRHLPKRKTAMNKYEDMTDAEIIKVRDEEMSRENLSAITNNLSTEEYFALDAVNQTLLKHVLRSPSHAALYVSSDDKPTAAMQFGTAVHATLLNPDNFDNEVAIKPDINRRTKDGKVQWEKFVLLTNGKAIIDQEQAAACISINHSLSLNETARDLIASGDHEQSFVWTDERTRLLCKARCDVVDNSGKRVIDFKTAADASPSGFARSVAKFGYHIQASFYLRAASGLPTAHAAYKDGWRFMIVAAESVKPYPVASYKIDERALIEGDKKIDLALGRWAESLLLNEFQGYPDELVTLSLPAWALTEPEDLGLQGA